jgi:CRP/FNR family transcriptional regulator, polysaccharide utilization system transcription regulator
MARVLIIEDSVEIRDNTSEMLTLEGYEVITAENGDEGLDIVRKKRPDVILCDIMMPGIDGFEVCRILKADATYSAIPFIFLSARSENNDVRSGIAAGAHAYLVKPFTMEELIEKVRSVTPQL